MFGVLPLSILLLTVRVIPGVALPSLTSIHRSWLPRTDPLSRSAQVTGVNYNPNGSAFLWLPQDEYSGSTFFEWVCIWNVDTFSSYSIPYQPLGFLQWTRSNKVCHKVLLLLALFNGCCVANEVETSSKPFHCVHNLSSQHEFIVASSMNQLHSPMDLYTFGKME